MAQRDAHLLEVMIGEIGKDVQIDIVFLEHCRIAFESQSGEPLLQIGHASFYAFMTRSRYWCVMLGQVDKRRRSSDIHAP